MEQRGRRPGGEEGRRGHGRWLMSDDWAAAAACGWWDAGREG